MTIVPARAVHLTAVVATYNRRALTVRGLKSTLQAAENAGCTIRFLVVDDNSSDGTREAVKETFGAHVQVIKGKGDLFWAGAMRLGMQTALEQGVGDYLMLLNDEDRKSVV